MASTQETGSATALPEENGSITAPTEEVRVNLSGETVASAHITQLAPSAETGSVTALDILQHLLRR